jgi:DNA repair protein RecO (recombination protein O)
VPGPVKTQAVVLRSIRYGEADRIVHLYTPGRGRVGAIAKGARRARSRFGGRLEPFFRLDLVLHEGRGELLTVTAAETVDGYARLRADGGALDAAARACDAVSRLFETDEPHPEVYNLLCNELALLDAEPARGTRSNQLAFRLKLLLAAGLAPQLAAWVVCRGCVATRFPLDAEAHEFLAGALGTPLAAAPDAPERALRQAERAISDTLEHHAGVRLRAASAG